MRSRKELKVIKVPEADHIVNCNSRLIIRLGSFILGRREGNRGTGERKDRNWESLSPFNQTFFVKPKGPCHRNEFFHI